jgi:hypothetical protein
MRNEESVEGYCVPLSVEPGEHVSLHTGVTRRLRAGAVDAASREIGFAVEVARLGATREIVWRVDGLVAKPHPVPTEAFARGAGYPESLRIPTRADWPSGFYEVRLRAHRPDGTSVDRCACFILRAPSGTRHDRPLFALATNTWNAYNDWGGANLYTGATHVSFLRPFAHGLLDRPEPLRHRIANRTRDPDLALRAFTDYARAHDVCGWCGSAGFPSFEGLFVQWAEKARYTFDYCTNVDLEARPELLEGRRLYLSVGHDEYWSSGMRDTVEAHVSGGGNALFLSGNTCFWQVRFEDDGATMVSYKDRARSQDPLRERDPAVRG